MVEILSCQIYRLPGELRAQFPGPGQYFWMTVDLTRFPDSPGSDEMEFGEAQPAERMAVFFQDIRIPFFTLPLGLHKHQGLAP